MQIILRNVREHVLMGIAKGMILFGNVNLNVSPRTIQIKECKECCQCVEEVRELCFDVESKFTNLAIGTLLVCMSVTVLIIPEFSSEIEAWVQFKTIVVKRCMV